MWAMQLFTDHARGVLNLRKDAPEQTSDSRVHGNAVGELFALAKLRIKKEGKAAISQA